MSEITTLEQLAATIPSMGGREIGPFLRKRAARVLTGEAIVELGCWLGAGTAQMALGVLDSKQRVQIHSYDYFKTRGSECEKAAAGGLILRKHENTESLVRSWLEPFRINLELHKGDIADTKWCGFPIALYVDDACKRKPAFLRALRTFAPWWITDRTVIVLMDYYYFLKNPDRALRFQYEFVKSHPQCFRQIWRSAEYSVAAFRYTGGLML